MPPAALMVASPGRSSVYRCLVRHGLFELEYFEPVVWPTFTIKGEIVNQRGVSSLVSTKFLQSDKMAAHALTTLRTLPSVETDPAGENP
jgi:hypothetical protein